MHAHLTVLLLFPIIRIKLFNYVIRLLSYIIFYFSLIYLLIQSFLRVPKILHIVRFIPTNFSFLVMFLYFNHFVFLFLALFKINRLLLTNIISFKRNSDRLTQGSCKKMFLHQWPKWSDQEGEGGKGRTTKEENFCFLFFIFFYFVPNR